MSSFLQMIGELLTSKKFIAMVAAWIVALVARRGFNVDPQIVEYVLGLVAVYIFAQGIADHKKEAAKIEAVSAASMSTGNTPKADAAIVSMAESVKNDA